MFKRNLLFRTLRDSHFEFETIWRTRVVNLKLMLTNLNIYYLNKAIFKYGGYGGNFKLIIIWRTSALF